MSSRLLAWFVMGMYPSSANSYDILAVYRLEPLSECVVRVHARCSFACDPSGGSILEHPLGRPDLRRCPPSHLTSSFDGEGICSVLSVCEAIPRGNKCSIQFNFSEGQHNFVMVSSRSQLDVLERRRNCL